MLYAISIGEIINGEMTDLHMCWSVGRAHIRVHIHTCKIPAYWHSLVRHQDTDSCLHTHSRLYNRTTASQYATRQQVSKSTASQYATSQQVSKSTASQYATSQQVSKSTASQYATSQQVSKSASQQQVSMPRLASCLMYARALLEYVIFIMWLRCVLLSRCYRPSNSRKIRCSLSLFSLKNDKMVQFWI